MDQCLQKVCSRINSFHCDADLRLALLSHISSLLLTNQSRYSTSQGLPRPFPSSPSGLPFLGFSSQISGFTLLCLWCRSDLLPWCGAPPCQNLAHLCFFCRVVGGLLHLDTVISHPQNLSAFGPFFSHSLSLSYFHLFLSRALNSLWFIRFMIIK